MPRIAKLSKSALADQISPIFENFGFEGASLAMLAETAGLSKASLYHHFPNGKDDMATYVLGRAGLRLQTHVLAPLQSKDPAETRLKESFKGVAAYYGGDVPVCLMNSLLLGQGVILFGEQIAAAVNAWKLGLTSAYFESNESLHRSESLAIIALERIQGALVFCRVLDEREPLEACLADLREEIGEK